MPLKGFNATKIYISKNTRYSRALKHGEHYITFWTKNKDDIFDVLEEWRSVS
jgi:hypothetical protein